MGLDCLFINIFHRYNFWSLGIYGQVFHPTLYWTGAYLSLLGLRLNHVKERGRCGETGAWFWAYIPCILHVTANCACYSVYGASTALYEHGAHELCSYYVTGVCHIMTSLKDAPYVTSCVHLWSRCTARTKFGYFIIDSRSREISQDLVFSPFWVV